MSEAEKGLLSCILNYPDLLSEEGMPAPSAYSSKSLRKYAAAAADLHANGFEVTIPAIAAHLAVEGEATPISDLTALQDLLADPTTWKFYAQRVREEAEKAEMARILREAMRQLRSEGAPQARRVLTQFLERVPATGHGVRSWSQLHAELFDMAERNYQKGGDDPGVLLPWRMLHRTLGGYGDGELAVVAGVPGGGKTVFAMQVAEHASNRGRVLVFSLEMRGVDLAARSVVRGLRVEGIDMSVRQAQGGRFAGDGNGGWATFSRVVGIEHQKNRPLFIDDAPSQTVAEICHRARIEHRKAQETGEKGLALIVVDYSQLIGFSGQFEQAHQEIGEAAKGLKALARELDCVVLLLAQLDAEGMKIVSGGGTPGMSNLAGSKDIGKHCDSLTFILWDRDDSTNSRSRHFGQFFIEKNRQGSTGAVRFHFDGERMEFREMLGEEVL